MGKNFSFLDNIYTNINGIIHIGAHEGQECHYYNKYKFPVLWIEALPDKYKQLIKNIKKLKNQTAINILLTDTIKKHTFYISNKNGASSSLFEFDKNSPFKKKIRHETSIELTSNTLDNILNDYTEYKKFNTLILDVQGAELLVLNGAKQSIKNFKYIYTEYSTKPVYKDGVLWPELKTWLNNNKFIEEFNPNNIHGNILFTKKG